MQTNNPLHRAVAEGNLEKVKQICQNWTAQSIDAEDPHGNTALHLAIHLKKSDIVEYLLSRGANPFYRNKSGWTALQEAQASGFRPTLAIVYKHCQNRLQAEYAEKLPLLAKALQKLPDFQLEMKWEFKSWVPFVSRFCPSDQYRIYKRGSSLRIDSTLLGFENTKWLRGALTMLFIGEENGQYVGHVIFIDHNSKLIEYAADCMHNDEKMLDEELSMLLEEELIYAEPSTKNVKVEPCRNWRGFEKIVKVGAWNCSLYELSGLEYRVLFRVLATLRGEKTSNVNHSEGTDLTKFNFDQYLAEAQGVAKPLLYKNEIIHVKRKTMKGTLFLTKEFSRSLDEFFPILDALFPSTQAVQTLKEVCKLFPPQGFPIRLELPVFPTVSFIASIERYKEIPQEVTLFTLPANYNYTPLSAKRNQQSGGTKSSNTNLS
jgi:hypothetical protein